jgi:ParB-like chromosome segregation protein Spo0J
MTRQSKIPRPQPAPIKATESDALAPRKDLGALAALLRGSDVRPYLEKHRSTREGALDSSAPSRKSRIASETETGSNAETPLVVDRTSVTPGRSAGGAASDGAFSVAENSTRAIPAVEFEGYVGEKSESPPANILVHERGSEARPAARLLYEVPLDEIIGLDQPRQDVGDIAELARDIKARGQVTPIILAPNPHWREGATLSALRWTVVAGHRRFAALSLLRSEHLGRSFTHIIAEIRGLDGVAHVLTRITENSARLDLSPVERAWEIVALQEALMKARQPHTLEVLRELLPGHLSLGTVSTYVRVGRSISLQVLTDAGFRRLDELAAWERSGLEYNEKRQAAVQIDWMRVRSELTLSDMAEAAKARTPGAVAARLAAVVSQRREAVLLAERKAELRALREKAPTAPESLAPTSDLRTGEEKTAGAEAGDNVPPDTFPTPAPAFSPYFTAAHLRKNGGFRKKLSRPFEQLEPNEAHQHMRDLTEAVLALGHQTAEGRSYSILPSTTGSLIWCETSLMHMRTREEVEAAAHLVEYLNSRIEHAAAALGITGQLRPANHLVPAAQKERAALEFEYRRLAEVVGPLKAAERRARRKSAENLTPFERGAMSELPDIQSRLKVVKQKLHGYGPRDFQ